jgi:ATP synthase protein I
MPFNRPIPNPKPQPKSATGVKSLVQAEKLMQIAVLLPATAIVGWLAGAWLDGKFHQNWIGLAGILFGGILGLVYVVRLVMNNGNSPGSQAKAAEEDSTARPDTK